MALSDENTRFSGSEWLRYTRHIQLPQVGVRGQQRLKNSQVLVVGAGGLGSPVSLYLAAAGVGHISLVDGDVVDITNLQRQILFDSQQIGMSKAECGKQRLEGLNPEIYVTAVSDYLSQSNAAKLIASVDLVIDCSDNFATRYLINDICKQHKKTWIFSAIYQFSGQCALFSPGGACFRCLFPEAPLGLDDCNTAGVLGVLPGILGTLQANEALKFLFGQSASLNEKLLIVDAMDLRFQQVRIVKNRNCLVCGSGGDASVEPPILSTCSDHIPDDLAITAEQFQLLRQKKNYIVMDVRTTAERAAFNIGGDHISLNDLQEFPERYLEKMERRQVLLCYCQSGQRSAEAARLFISKGIESKSLSGGLVEWLKQSL